MRKKILRRTVTDEDETSEGVPRAAALVEAVPRGLALCFCESLARNRRMLRVAADHEESHTLRRRRETSPVKIRDPRPDGNDGQAYGMHAESFPRQRPSKFLKSGSDSLARPISIIEFQAHSLEP